MTVSMRTSTPAGPKTIVLERAYSAPRELLFSLFTDPAHLTRWWVPYALTNPVCEFDARPGGSIRLVMQAPDGTRFPFIGTVHEVDAPNRLVFTTVGIDPAGEPHIEALQTITFAEREGKTVVRVEIEVVTATEAGLETLIPMSVGWMQDLGRLEFYLLTHPAGGRRSADAGETALVVTMPSDREIMVTRTFDAPRAAVFAALTDPAMIPVWWKPRDLRHGPGEESPIYSGEYHSVVPLELAVNAFEFKPTAGYIGIDAVHLHERDGKTCLTGISLFPSRDERDAALLNGLVRDATKTYERLAAALTSRA